MNQQDPLQDLLSSQLNEQSYCHKMYIHLDFLLSYLQYL